MDSKPVSGFARAVRAAVKRIPAGKVMAYGRVATAAGYPGAARAVGQMMAANRDPAVPCHRVIRSDRSLGGYNRGQSQKRRRLRAEGVAIRLGRVLPDHLL